MLVGKKQLSLLVLLSVISSSSVSPQTSPSTTGSTCQKVVDAFITLPSRNALAAVEESDDATCWAVLGSSNTNLNKLEHWVEQGNRWAAEYLSKHLKQLDGGNLEDALVALGQFSNHDMENLLLFAKRGLLSKQELSDALTMLPLSLSDNPKAQLASLSRRKTNLLRVTRKDVSEQRAQALSAIDAFAAEIRSKNPGSDH